MSLRFEPKEGPHFTRKDVTRLKEVFKKEINSERRFEEISTIKELFEVLEDRDALTDEVLLEADPEFQKFVQSQRNNGKSNKELVLPKAVVKFLSESYTDEWQKFAQQLKLSEEKISQCQNVKDVLLFFAENCEGVSYQEMIFRLNRALEKCGKANLKSRVVELMKVQNF